eukprot:g5924.t1
MALQDSGIFIASSLIADTPEKDKENAEPTGDTPAAARAGRRSGEGGARSARKSLLGRRRSSVGRRLSGFGGVGFDASADQSKLTSMYSNIIKLNSENKITREKCWGLHLIDFMDKVIMDEGGQMGGSKVNFQKASCTLDASVKIYSHRVDATHMMGYSLLENLNRTDNDKPADGGATLGSSERSTRLGVHETLKKRDQLNQSETDRAFKMDPMFHKMSKIFDEAGSKGMLLNNLSVSDGCKVSFDSDSATAPPSPESAEAAPAGRVFKRPGEAGGEKENEESPENGQGAEEGETSKETEKQAAAAAAAAEAAAGGMTDIRELRSTLFSLCGDLSRGHRGGDDSDSDGGDGEGFYDAPGSDGGGSFDGGADFGGGGGGGDDDDGAGDGGFPEFGGGTPDDADPFQADNGDGFGVGGVSFLDGNDDDHSGGGAGGLGGRASSGSGTTASMTPVSLEDRLCVDMKIVNDDYAFYDTGALAAAAATSRNNTWAGASHWKFVGVKKKRPNRTAKRVSSGDGGDVSPAEDGEDGGGRKTRGKRKPPAIDFDGPAVPAGALADPSKPKGRGRRAAQAPTLLSEDYVKRAYKAAEDESSNYALPENAGFKTKDLGELFLRPGAFTKRWTGGESAGVSEGARLDVQGFHDTNGGSGDDDLLFADANDGYSGGDDFDDDDDDDGSEGFHFAGGFDADGAAAAGGEGGAAAEIGEDGVFVDNFEGRGLLSAGRRVEKISVNYARKAKRVDVRRLKGDLWHKIHTEFQSDTAATPPAKESAVEVGEENVDGSKTEEEPEPPKDDAKESEPEVVDMTFSGIVQDVASTEEQSGVTVPFYFICLLHLANEKGLRLEGRDDLLDFSVASDPVKEGSY